MPVNMKLALYEPEIAQNTGTMLRLAACVGVGVDIVHPCGFPFSSRALKRAGMDYIDLADITEHDDFAAFEESRAKANSRLILLTTKAAEPFAGFQFKPDDTIMMGRESAGVPDHVHAAADARLLIPMVSTARSLNVAVTAAMVLGEALRQTDQFPSAK